jgi:hypothetical protein
VLLGSVLLLNFAIAPRAQGSEGPSFSMLPDTLAAGAPAGYSLNLNIPSGPAPGVEQMSVTLPTGTVISPAAGAGLGTCSNEQFALGSSQPAACPAGSQVGAAQLEASASEQPSASGQPQGQVFLGEPSCDPCTPADAQSGRMVRLFVQVRPASEASVAFKLEGAVEINQQTGQLTVAFEQVPQVPFNDLRLSLNGGAGALLANPRTCGPATSNLALLPSSPSATPEFLTD